MLKDYFDTYIGLWVHGTSIFWPLKILPDQKNPLWLNIQSNPPDFHLYLARYPHIYENWMFYYQHNCQRNVNWIACCYLIMTSCSHWQKLNLVYLAHLFALSTNSTRYHNINRFRIWLHIFQWILNSLFWTGLNLRKHSCFNSE